ncbi:hypothetical protein ACOSQ2_011073 [Xanthoceras sorbifolium]
MASFIFATAFLLALISSYGIITTEERLLKITERNKKCGNLVIRPHESSTGVASEESGNDDDHMINSRRNVLEDAESQEPSPDGGVHVDVDVKSAHDTDDFRPTEPGHSPGAGHSNGPRGKGLN